MPASGIELPVIPAGSPATAITLSVSDNTTVSGVLMTPAHNRLCLVLAHGAGAGMNHASMSAIADGLYRRGVATLRYQFPYMQHGGRRPDSPAMCHATVRAAVAAASELLGGAALFAGGRSFGGRMTSQAQAAQPLPEVLGLAFFGFPLHVAKTPSDARAAHLDQVQIPMLFLQGSRDELADLTLLRPVIAKLRPRATLEVMDHADHSFHVPVRSGRTDDQVREQMLDAFLAWATKLLG
jgi:predicted alpha/beta-hydrolase family hydrolase